jgi:predicted RNA-binding protein Jag
MSNMSSYERRLCHMVLAKIEGVISESEGEGEERHIVIKKC